VRSSRPQILASMLRRLLESPSSVLRCFMDPFSAVSAPSAFSALKRDAAIVLLAIATAGCPSAPKQVVYDLAARTPFAERWSSRDVLLFGTPAAEPSLVEGFYREAIAPSGDSFVWAGGEAELSLQWTAPAPRAAILDLAPFRGVRAQTFELRLNGQPAGRAVLNEQ